MELAIHNSHLFRGYRLEEEIVRSRTKFFHDQYWDHHILTTSKSGLKYVPLSKLMFDGGKAPVHEMLSTAPTLQPRKSVVNTAVLAFPRLNTDRETTKREQNRNIVDD